MSPGNISYQDTPPPMNDFPVRLLSVACRIFANCLKRTGTLMNTKMSAAASGPCVSQYEHSQHRVLRMEVLDQVNRKVYLYLEACTSHTFEVLVPCICASTHTLMLRTSHLGSEGVIVELTRIEELDRTHNSVYHCK